MTKVLIVDDSSHTKSIARELIKSLEGMFIEEYIPHEYELVNYANRHLEEVAMTEKKQPNFVRFQNNFKRYRK